MEITKANINEVKAEKSKLLREKKVSSKGTDASQKDAQNSVKKDKIDVQSSFSGIKKALAATDDVRTEKVQKIADKISSGEFKIDSKAIASKIVDDVLDFIS